MKDKLWLFGGYSPEHNDLHSGQDTSEHQIMPFRFKGDHNQDMFEALPEHRLLFSRRRSTALTDGVRFVYILGSSI